MVACGEFSFCWVCCLGLLLWFVFDVVNCCGIFGLGFVAWPGLVMVVGGMDW